ncbi:Gfo/Idh/MocA family oxidoreductase [Pyxidicoccus fallax]|uniref:Gfo/Idh/MocA family oxidoreductase n=1 Tax=Pyxidicoccus fallax TaxID=394095 RepID=A0A848LRX9_9BACT|nr:Gfo/Idh/MocA family oxidoreductase [Pyxidicoccus fallax]NMO20293.1 Gfo/Idh/MocA family oxidoreductase [Pyxidicoccus fallax]NPC81038.1 Gfo/Idh/MocA family oxidoreductase [Pyxidicoccus fallax]
MRRIRVGVIGASTRGGWATLTHLPALKALPPYEVTAVSTTRRDSAEETARRFGVPHAFDRAEALVAHPEVDLVVVSVRGPEHERLVRAAVDAGKHVLCEWPAGTSTAQTAAMLARAESAGVRHVVGLQRRLAPGVRYLKDLVADGYVGRLRSATLRVAIPMMGAQRPAAAAYTADAANGVNTLTILAAHYLDTLLAVVGGIRDVSAVVARQFDHTVLVETGESVPVTSPDQVLLSGTLQSGAVLSAHIEAGKRSGGDVGITLTGTEGDLVLRGDLTVAGTRGEGTPLETLPTPEHYLWLPASGLSGEPLEVAHLYAAFARDLAEGTRLAPTFHDALELHRLLDTLVEASETGRRMAVRSSAEARSP